MNIYLAGPMRGYVDFNYPAFHKASDALRAEGHTVFSPAENDIEQLGEDVATGTSGDLSEIVAKGFNLRDAIMDDLTYIARHADAIALLPGWQASKGVRVERALAEFLDLKVMEL